MNTDEQILQDVARMKSIARLRHKRGRARRRCSESTGWEEETEEVQDTESDEDGTDSEPEQKKVEDTQPKKKSNSNFAKILAERNALPTAPREDWLIIW